jgi:hypothetical protein
MERKPSNPFLLKGYACIVALAAALASFRRQGRIE